MRFPIEQASLLTGWFGGAVWFLAGFGGVIVDRLGFRRALSLAYLILGCAYFLLGSIGSFSPVRHDLSLTTCVALVLFLPALGIALVKPSVVGTTSRASKESVRAVGYSVYYTMVNLGGVAGPLLASWIHHHLSAENVFRVAAACVLVMLVVVLLFFKEPEPSNGNRDNNSANPIQSLWIIISNPRLMVFLLVFSGYWAVYWQEFIVLPLYVHNYIDGKIDTQLMLMTGPVIVVCFTVPLNLCTKKVGALRAVILGTLITSTAWLLLILHSSVAMIYLTLVVVAIGEITLSPKYYEYISRLAPQGQLGAYMGFAFVPLGIGSLIAGWLGGRLITRFGQVGHHPARIWWAVAMTGFVTAVLLSIYERLLARNETRSGES